MTKWCKDLILLLVSFIFFPDFKVFAQSCQHPDKTNANNSQNETSSLEQDCVNTSLVELLAECSKNTNIVEIKFSNGSSVIRGCNGTIEQEKPTTNRVIKSCREAQLSGIYILEYNGKKIDVYCDTDYEAGDWIVMQRRMLGVVDFYRNWTDYKEGFGYLGGEFWLGNEKIYQLTKDQPREVHFILTDWDDRTAVAKYSSFQIGSEEQKYVMRSVGIYRGSAGDSFSENLYSKFSAMDQDNDSSSTRHCAIVYHGAWWYRECHHSNLNGKYVKGTVSEYATSMCWHTFMGYYYGLKTSKILIRF
ncbi:ficolin-1-like isoform X2 [Malaya genurostris]|uniref:ficolin-1-like isoform X2 n=1 Tax=Malaya genurostris TaxID=325434 RepID=UPI0026F388B7|nr:ficolin-1-like isoform X2 [Malaya genurostris]